MFFLKFFLGNILKVALIRGYVFFPFLEDVKYVTTFRLGSPLATDSPCANSATRQKPAMCDTPLYIYVTSEPIMQLQIILGLEYNNFDDILTSFQPQLHRV